MSDIDSDQTSRTRTVQHIRGLSSPGMLTGLRPGLRQLSRWEKSREAHFAPTSLARRGQDMRTTLCFLLVAFSGLASVAKPQSSANSQQAVNINVASTAGVIPGYKAVAGSGLSLSLSAGTVFCNGTTQNYAGGSLPMTASAISYVYLDPTANCAPAVNTTGFTAGAIPIATVVTSISAITNVTDVRTISLGSGGGAGVGGCATNQFVTAINSGASPTCAQPAFSNLYGTAAVAQLPMATAASQGILQLAGDLAGNAATPTVTGLQGNPVSATTPGSNQVLQWNGTQWAPSTLPAGAGIGACAANQFVSAIYNGVAPTCLQPAFSNLSGAASASQLPSASSAAQGILQLSGDLGGNPTSPQIVSTHLASPLPIAQGGSGAGNFTAHSVLVGEGSGTFGTAGPGTTGQCLISNGTSADPAFAPCPNGGGTPGGANTQLQFNNGGAFAGASNFTYASGTGLLTLNQLANGNDTFYGKRTTDSSPTGNLIHFQNAAGTADLFKVDALGNVTATSFTSTTSGSFSLTGAEGTCSGAAAGKDVLCLGDATSHSAQISLNGGAFVSIPQLAGDIGGSASAPTVVALQGHPLSTAAPASNQVLQWNGTQWIPSTLPSASSTTQGILQLAGDFGGTAAVPKVTATHLSSPLPIAQGGTGHNTASTAFNALAPVTAKGGVIVGTGTNTYGNLALGTSGQCLTSNGSTAVWGACGGSATPGGANTQLQFNNSGAFAGASNFTYASGTGLLTLNQLANGNDTLYGKRTTDNAPTGNLIHFQNAAGTADLFKVDALGNVTATSFTSTTSGPFSLTGAEGTCSGATAGKDVLCLGDTTSHSAQISLNGGAFVSIPQLAGDLSGSANAPQVVSTHLGHLNQNSANGDIAGTVSLSSATSASHTFSVTFNSAPICVLTPTSDPGSGQRYWVTTTATTVTANVSAAATITFNYHCTGNPN